jgi:hypothetical protein
VALGVACSSVPEKERKKKGKFPHLIVYYPENMAE